MKCLQASITGAWPTDLSHKMSHTDMCFSVHMRFNSGNYRTVRPHTCICIENSCYRDRCKWSLKVSRDGDGGAWSAYPRWCRPLIDASRWPWPRSSDAGAHCVHAVGGDRRRSGISSNWNNPSSWGRSIWRNFAWIHAPRPARDEAR